jgi:hypothetical protein
MPRAYTVATAALALHISPKWLDNILSHYHVQGVSQARQGVARRLSIESLTILAIAVLLIQDLDLPVAKALTLATRLIQSRGMTALPSGVQLQIDIDQTSGDLLQRLERAVEIAPLPRRGRPPQKTTGRLD